MRSKLFATCLLVFLAAILFALTPGALAGGWSEPTNLGQARPDPAVALDSSGGAHFAWVSPNGKRLRYRFCPNLTEQVCDATQTVPTTGGGIGSPSLSLDSQDRPNLVWHQSDGKSTAVFYSRHEGGIWSAPDKVSPAGSSMPAVAVDDFDQVHLVYQTVQGNSAEIMYATAPVGASLSAPTALAGLDADLPTATEMATGLRPRVAVDWFGHAHVVWQSGSQNQIWYASQNEDGSFSSPLLVSSHHDDSNPDIVVSTHNNLVGIVWATRKDENLAFAIINDGIRALLHYGIAGNLRNARAPAIAADCRGVFQIAFQGRKAGDEWGIYSRFYDPFYNWWGERSTVVDNRKDNVTPAISALQSAVIAFTNSSGEDVLGTISTVRDNCSVPAPTVENGVEHVGNDDPRIRYIRPWRPVRDDKASSGEYARCDDGDSCQEYSTIWFDFTGGRRLEWHTGYANTFGVAEVWVDGSRFELVDLCRLNSDSGKVKFGKRTYVLSGGPETTHRFQVVALGGSNCTKGNKNFMIVDGFNILE